MTTQHDLKSAVIAVGLVSVMVGTEAVQVKPTPSSAMELAVVLRTRTYLLEWSFRTRRSTATAPSLPRPPSRRSTHRRLGPGRKAA
jgi:hypothetical protein